MTGIEWTHRPGTTGERWNPIRARNRETGGVGHFCEHVSEGCRNCYAERLQVRFRNSIRYAAQDRDRVEIFLDEAVLTRPLRWRKPRTIFVCSMTDPFGWWVPEEWIARLCAIMASCPQHTFIVLTKRDERMRRLFVAYGKEKGERLRMMLADLHAPGGKWCEGIVWPLPNVWLGVSIEDRQNGERRAWELAQTPAALRFWSVEPLLEDLGNMTTLGLFDTLDGKRKAVGWVIVGGESGPGARPMHPDWARGVRDQCAAAGMPFFFKQWGEWAPFAELLANGMVPGTRLYDRVNSTDFHNTKRIHNFGPVTVCRVGKKAAGALLDGRAHREWPSASPERTQEEG